MSSRLDVLLKHWVGVFNEHQVIEGDADLCLTPDQAKHSDYFLYWCNQWHEDSRGKLANLLSNVRHLKRR